MKSKIFLTRIYHSRLKPLKNTFTYDIFYFVFDLDELERGQLDNALFAYNRQSMNLISINSEDYIGRDKSKTIKEKLKLQFKLDTNPKDIQEKSDKIHRVSLVTSPRYFNHSFNPVNFYYCYDQNGAMIQIVMEINNTFGETHIYFPNSSDISNQNQQYPLGSDKNKNTYHISSNKVFHVSPFNSLDGIYDCYFSDLDNDLFDIRINVLSDLDKDSLEFSPKEPPSSGNQHFDYIILTRLWSTSPPIEFNTSNLIKNILVKFPITSFLTLPRIMYQAGYLHYQRKLKVYSKPNPPNNLNTSIIPPITPYQRKAKEMVLSFLSKFPCGHFKIHFPVAGYQTDIGFIEIKNSRKSLSPSQSFDQEIQLIPENLYSKVNLNPIEIHVQTNEFFVKLYEGLDKNVQGFSSKSIGLAYVANDFKCSDLPTLLFILCDLTQSNNNIKPLEPLPIEQDKARIEYIFSDLVHFIESPINLYSIFLDDKNGYLCFDQINNYEEYDSDGETNLVDENSQQNHQQLHLFSNIFNDFKCTDNSILNILEIEPNWTKSINGLFFYYLSKNLEKFNYTIIISDQKKFKYISKLINSFKLGNTDKETSPNQNIKIINLDFKGYCNSITGSDERFNRILCVENLEESLLSIPQTNERISYFIQQCNNTLIDGNCKSFIYLQSITGPYQQYQEIFNQKPIPEVTGTGYYQIFTNYLASTTWGIFSEFQTSPFKLKDRYQYLMKLLSKNYINCHFQDNNNSNIHVTLESTGILEEIQNQKHFKIKQLVNLDNYSQIQSKWLENAQDQENLERISNLIQSFVKSNGCSLKMNQQDINEIFYAIQFHLSILIASFKSVYSISKILLEN